MYVGALSDFFYKPKNFISNIPKYKQRHDIIYLNIHNKIFRINNITWTINLLNKPDVHSLTIKKGKIINNQKPINFRNKKIRDNNIYFTMNKTANIKSKGINDYTNKALTNRDIKLTNLKKNYKKKIKKLSTLELNDSYKTSFNIKPQKIKSIKIVEETFKKNILPYHYKSQKKNKKSSKIAFGQKIYFETIPNKNNPNPHPNFSQKKNSFLTIYKQHFNNLSNVGNNDRIYFENKDDDAIIKALKKQILKEKVENDLKNKFRFYLSEKNNSLKIPNLSPKNFEFYNGYSISDRKRANNTYHKLFFKYVNKHKYEENKEKKEKSVQKENDD